MIIWYEELKNILVMGFYSVKREMGVVILTPRQTLHSCIWNPRYLFTSFRYRQLLYICYVPISCIIIVSIY
jgi:hypothetical protein